jgi:hypothetical protein
MRVDVRIAPDSAPGLPVEDTGIVSIPATQTTAQRAWTEVPGLGSFGAAMRSDLTMTSVPSPAQSASVLSYAFATTSQASARLKVVAVPVHPLTSANGLRIAVSIDGAPFETFDFATHGRSDEWKANVLSNTAVREQVLDALAPGRHRLDIRALDPGFILDRIEIDFDGAPAFYGRPRIGPDRTMMN